MPLKRHVHKHEVILMIMYTLKTFYRLASKYFRTGFEKPPFVFYKNVILSEYSFPLKTLNHHSLHHFILDKYNFFAYQLQE